MTYSEFMEFALENYEKGGDSFYECWDEKTFDYHVAEYGVIDKSKARRMFLQAESHRKEIESTIW